MVKDFFVKPDAPAAPVGTFSATAAALSKSAYQWEGLASWQTAVEVRRQREIKEKACFIVWRILIAIPVKMET